VNNSFDLFSFPVEVNAAIYAFIARIDDEREIVAELKEKKTAQREYTEALAQGHGAYLLEQDEASNDIFIVSVGAYVTIFFPIEYPVHFIMFSSRLQPGSQCRITISYVSELDLLHSSKKPTIRFVIPTTIAPRYSPSHGGIASPGGTQAEYVQSVPYTIEFTCQVEKLDQHVASISSPSHPIKIDTSNDEMFLVTFSQQDIALE
jgi:von Willebrand factor A domain-containing protein 5